jgi:hypothetical protein
VKEGDAVLITCDGRTVRGTIVLASPNERSLMLEFEAMLHGFVGKMPVLRDDAGVYRTVIGQHPVKIEPMGTVQ